MSCLMVTVSQRKCRGAHNITEIQAEQGLVFKMQLSFQAQVGAKLEGKKKSKPHTSPPYFSLTLALCSFCSPALNSDNSKCFDGLNDKRGAFKYSRNDLFIVLSSIVSEALPQVVEAGWICTQIVWRRRRQECYSCSFRLCVASPLSASFTAVFLSAAVRALVDVRTRVWKWWFPYHTSPLFSLNKTQGSPV